MSADGARRANPLSARRGVAGWLDPRRAFWLGVVISLLGIFGTIAVVRSTTEAGGQNLTVSWPIWTLIYLLGLTVPLGASFLAASMVAGRFGSFHRVEEDETAGTEESRVPPRLSPRVAVIAGIALIALAALDQNLHFVERVPPTGVERDILSILVPLLGVLAPIGTALIPAGWLLARLDESSGDPKARADARSETETF